jgi:hypothetical protein
MGNFSDARTAGLGLDLKQMRLRLVPSSGWAETVFTGFDLRPSTFDLCRLEVP